MIDRQLYLANRATPTVATVAAATAAPHTDQSIPKHTHII